jgi:hypothetical protein
VVIIPWNVWAILVSAPHSEASGLPRHMRLAASVLILPNLLNIYWATLMVKVGLSCEHDCPLPCMCVTQTRVGMVRPSRSEERRVTTMQGLLAMKKKPKGA